MQRSLVGDGAPREGIEGGTRHALSDLRSGPPGPSLEQLQGLEEAVRCDPSLLVSVMYRMLFARGLERAGTASARTAELRLVTVGGCFS